MLAWPVAYFSLSGDQNMPALPSFPLSDRRLQFPSKSSAHDSDQFPLHHLLRWNNGESSGMPHNDNQTVCLVCGPGTRRPGCLTTSFCYLCATKTPCGFSHTFSSLGATMNNGVVNKQLSRLLLTTLNPNRAPESASSLVALDRGRLLWRFSLWLEWHKRETAEEKNGNEA